MSVASALLSGDEPGTGLAEAAVREAMSIAGLRCASSVLLLLSPEFSRHAAAAVRTAARSGGCTQVFGGIAAGLCNETGWALDRPSVAAMVFGGRLSLAAHARSPGAPLLCFAATNLPAASATGSRFGLHYHGAGGQGAVWRQGRIDSTRTVEASVVGATPEFIHSPGLQQIGAALQVDAVRGYDLLTHGRLPALDSLRRLLPDDWSNRQPLPIHLMTALIDRADGSTCQASLISANADGSVTLTESLQPGDILGWALRTPAGAEQETRGQLAATADDRPAFALFLSCIGRGPYFYGSDDRDLAALCERFPGMPVIGAYGTGQIVPARDGSRQQQNSVIIALYRETPHVQSES